MKISTHLFQGIGRKAPGGLPHGSRSASDNPMPAERSGQHTTVTGRTRALSPEMIEHIIARQQDRYS